MVPTQVHGPKAKFELFAPLIAMLDIVTAAVDVFSTKTATSNPVEFRATVPN
jgi:hypothetical protein